MSTHVTIVKKPSGHNLKVEVVNPGNPQVAATHLLSDNQAVEVMVYGGSPTESGGGTVTLSEIDKPAVAS